MGKLAPQLILEEKLTPNEKIILLFLYNHRDDSGWISTRRHRISTYFNITRQTIAKVLEALERKNYIRIVIDGKYRQYKLLKKALNIIEG